MPKLNRDDYMEKLSQLIPGDDEESLALIADFVDTYDGFGNGENEYKTKYENLRKQYRERFFNGRVSDNDFVENESNTGNPESDIIEPENNDENLTEAEIFDKYMPPIKEGE